MGKKKRKSSQEDVNFVSLDETQNYDESELEDETVDLDDAETEELVSAEESEKADESDSAEESEESNSAEETEEPNSAEESEESNSAEEGEESDSSKKTEESGSTEESDEKEEVTESDGSEDLEIVNLDDEEIEKKSVRKKGLWWKILAGIFGALGVAYLGTVVFFNFFYYQGTVINGVEVSLLTVADAEKYFADVVGVYELDLHTSDDEIETIQGTDFGIKYVQDEQLKNILASQNPWTWFEMFNEENKYEYDYQISVEYDENLLKEAMAELEFMQKENMEQPENAETVLVDGKYEIKPETIGSIVVEAFLYPALEEPILMMADVVKLAEIGAYQEAEVTSEHASVNELMENLNRYVTSTITYSSGEVASGDVIAEWLIVDENNQVTVDEEKVQVYVEQLAENNNTVGTTRTFIAGDGDEATVSGGDYGFEVDEEAEYEQILADLEAGEPVTRDIVYSQVGLSHGEVDWGDTYAEVDLTDQKVYFILEGEVVLESDTVTGSLSAGHDTPQGVFDLTYKTKNAVLRGAVRPDGTREYESPVSFWMPFNGGIGFHDASWRSSYGGEIYKTNGSHGCINMPYDNAKALYELMDHLGDDTPVICHF